MVVPRLSSNVGGLDPAGLGRLVAVDDSIDEGDALQAVGTGGHIMPRPGRLAALPPRPDGLGKPA